MPTIDWLQREFSYGYSSGDILSDAGDPVLLKEEQVVGGSYRDIFMEAIATYLRPDSRVLELGPGRGSWSRAILKYIPNGKLHTIDFQDVSQWLDVDQYGGRLTCHTVTENSFACVADDTFDFFWSFGVLCHNNVEQIEQILGNALNKVKVGGIAIHQYADWSKLDDFGWERGNVPKSFQDLPDDEIWWPRNNRATMVAISHRAGWDVLDPDLGLLERDSMVKLQRKVHKQM
ncbi:MAG: class I SAM-dependent methyltransferase [Cyanothece sp. SIO2G6]|nr:class I SAM-dependent methyltransferase [Cyanothece sp. SIO2G6]